MLRGVNFNMSRFQVYIDYDPEFIIEAHRLNGRYRRASRMWTFEREKYSQVVAVLNRLYSAGLPPTDPLTGG